MFGVKRAPDNLFDSNKDSTGKPVKKKGTIVPVPTNATGKVLDFKDKHAKHAAAKTSLDSAKDDVREIALAEYARIVGESHAMPPAPFKLAEENGDSATLAVSDKSRSADISDKSEAIVRQRLGDHVMEYLLRHVVTSTVYSFNTEVMNQSSTESTREEIVTVGDVVAREVSKALANCRTISDAQKQHLIMNDSKRTLASSSLAKIISDLDNVDPLLLLETFRDVGIIQVSVTND